MGDARSPTASCQASQTASPGPPRKIRAWTMEIRSDIRVALKLRMVRFLITPFRSSVSLTVPGTESNAANTSGPGRPQRWPTPPLHLIQTRLGRASSGVRLVISDDHRGLVKAVGEQLWVLRGSAVASTSPGTPATSSPARRGAWSRPSSGRSSNKPDEASARAQLRRVVDGLEARFPAVASGQHQDVAQVQWAGSSRRPRQRPLRGRGRRNDPTQAPP